MKSFSLLIVFIFVALESITTIANPSWIMQHANGLPKSANPTLTLSAVSANVCWGVQQLEAGVTSPKYILTTNGGKTWIVSSLKIPSGLGVQSIFALDAQTAFITADDPNNGTNSGIYKSTNGGSYWVKKGSAFTGGGHPVSIYFFDFNNGICVGNPRNNDFEIYTTADGGESWNQVPGANIPAPDFGDVTFSSISSGSGNTFIFGTFNRRIYRSTDKGLSWQKISFSTSPSGAGVDISLKDSINGLACTYFGDHINRAAKTTDAGLSWTSISNPPSEPSAYFLSYVPGGNGSTYIVTSHDNIGAPEPTTPGSMVTTDNGLTWDSIDTIPHGPASFAPDGYGWSGGVGDIIYKISYNNVLPVELSSFRSNTEGNNIRLSWQTASEINNRGFEIYRNGEKISFIDGKGTTTEKQNYFFVDKGLSAGIYNYRLNQIDFDGTQKIVGENTVNLILPEQFSLDQNYPNPFNPSTKIDFTIPQSSFINLTVYNVLGEKVVTLVNETKAPGNYEVNFSAANLPSEIYIYKLQAGSFTESKKMILLK